VSSDFRYDGIIVRRSDSNFTFQSKIFDLASKFPTLVAHTDSKCIPESTQVMYACCRMRNFVFARRGFTEVLDGKWSDLVFIIVLVQVRLHFGGVRSRAYGRREYSSKHMFDVSL